jgi:predicted nuclease of predicted toxin-antitoxin system
MTHKSAIRLYLDADIPRGLAPALRQRGFDVESAYEAHNLALLDFEQLEYAVSQERALMTFNIRDYAILHRSWLKGNREHFGIAVSPQIPKRQFGVLLRRTLKFLSSQSSEEIYNNFFFLSTL